MAAQQPAPCVALALLGLVGGISPALAQCSSGSTGGYCPPAASPGRDASLGMPPEAPGLDRTSPGITLRGPGQFSFGTAGPMEAGPRDAGPAGAIESGPAAPPAGALPPAAPTDPTAGLNGRLNPTMPIGGLGSGRGASGMGPATVLWNTEAVMHKADDAGSYCNVNSKGPSSRPCF